MRNRLAPAVVGTQNLLLALLAVGVLSAASCQDRDKHDPTSDAEVSLITSALTTPSPWKTATNYAVGAQVTYNNIVYECRQAHKSQTGWEPPKVPALWQRPTPADNQPWTNQTHYIVGLRVTYQNLLYKCLQEHVSQLDWTPTAARTLWQNVPDATVVIDPSIAPPNPVIDSLEDGNPRSTGTLAGPGNAPEEVVMDEIALQAMSDADLQAFNTKWGGVTLRRGVTGTGSAPPPQNAGDLGPLVRINPALAPLSQLGRLLAMRGVQGTVRFSSERVARLLAVALSDARATPNQMMELDAPIPEHPDDSGGNLDANDPSLFPQYVLSNVQLAWKYLQYKGFPPPPPGGAWTRPTLAVIDCGFDMTPSGVPGGNNPDYDFFFKQVDLVQRDGTAGGQCPKKDAFHGQHTFSVAAATVGNSSGSAGVAGTVAIPMIMRTDLSAWMLTDGIRSAALRGASVISISMGGGCGLLCRAFTDLQTRMAGAAGFATNQGAIVLAAAGNERIDLGTSIRFPCTANNTICVGGTNLDRSNQYNFGSVVDIWAPVDFGILVTPDPLTRAQDADNVGINELSNFNGTSAATPFVAGVAAMMKTLDPSIRQEQVLSILRSTAISSPDTRVRGVVNALAALEAVSPNVPPIIVVNSPVEGATVSPRGVRLSATVTDPDTKLPPSIQVAWFDTDGHLLCVAATCDSGPLSPGDHTIQVKAADEVGGLTETEVHIHVVNTAPTPAITLPGNGSTFFVGQLIAFRGTGSDPDQDSSSLQLAWSSSRDGALGTGPDISTTLTEGVHVITLQVTDQFGASNSVSISITVQPPGGVPSGQIFPRGDGADFPPGTLIHFEGSGFDPDDGELPPGSLSWSSSIDGFLGTGRQLDTALSPPPDLCHPEGFANHIITLTVTDSDGNQSTFSILVKVGLIC